MTRALKEVREGGAMVVYKGRTVLGGGNSTCKGPEVGPSFVSWRKGEKARVVEAERPLKTSACALSW